MRAALNLMPQALADKMARMLFGVRLRKHSPSPKSHALHVNLGCGARPIFGWLNLDLVTRPDVIWWDCRRGLPFENNSVSFIFTERFFERLQYPEETSLFLSECLRCLEPRGVIRVVVRDAGMYLKLYAAPGWDGLASAWPLEKQDNHFIDVWRGGRFETKMQLINALFRKECRYAYDAETLIMHLRGAGFAECTQQRFGSSSSLNETCPDDPARQTHSLYVEATKRE
jgi:predicted SAM-dependent methyltransferase